MRSRLSSALWMALALLGLTSALCAADFPRWRGANSNGSAGDTAMPLVKSWDDVRVAWASEVKTPHPWNRTVIRGRTQWPRTVLGNGGYCEPTIWDGKVYVSFYRPKEAGTIAALEQPRADLVIVCMGATTGRTLWEAVWEGTEANQIEPYGGHNNMSIADGRCYAIGNTGKVYCADATTGKRLWMNGVHGGAPIVEPPLPPHPLGGSLDTSTYNSCPAVADGVVVVGGTGGSTGLSGLDAVTGKHLWSNPRAIGGLSPPLRWVHEGKEYFICSQGMLQCVEPRTGAILWTGPPAYNGGYDSSTPAIDGDLLITHGPPPKAVVGLPPDQQVGWTCYRLSPTGATKAWSLSSAYMGTGYIAATIHRGNAWLQFIRAKDAVGLIGEDVKGDGGMVCVEAATGKVLGELNNVPLSSVCPGPVAMGDLLIYQGDKYLWLADISDPSAPKFLGSKLQPINFCSSATAADGYVYFRSAERLVSCLDVRRPDARPAIARHDDPKNARFDLTLDEGLRDGGTPRLFARGRDGAFPQTWATVPEDYSYPDVLYPGNLRIDDGKLVGDVSALLRGIPYTYKLSGTLKDGVVDGEFEDTYRGIPVKDVVTGSALSRAYRNAQFTLSWPRHWIDGQNQSVEHKCYITLTNGVVTDVQLKHRLPARPGIFAKTESFDLRFKDGRLTGYAILQVTIPDGATGISGRYRVDFDMTMLNNLFSGTVQSTRDGFATTTYTPEGFMNVQGGGERPTTTHPAWGDAQVPGAEPFSPANAVYTLDLKNCLLVENATSGAFDTRFFVTVADGKVVGATANARGTAGLQRADASGLRLEGNRLKGRLEVWVNPDGYVHRSSSHNVYDIDVQVDGNDVQGSYNGFFDYRAPNRGRLTGTYVND